MTQEPDASADGYAAFLAAAREVEQIIHASPALSDADRAEGYLYLAGMWQFHLERLFKGGDVDRPCFIRVMDAHRSWGFPTPDHHYYAAQIDGSGTYRISGRRGEVVDYCFEVLSGLVGDDGIAGERIDALEADRLQLDPEGRFELRIGGEPQLSNWLRAGANARTIFVRQTSNDWQTQRASPMLIERIDRRGAVSAFTRPCHAAVQGLFRKAAENMIQQVRFLDGLRRHWATTLPLNALPVPAVGPADAGYFPGQYNTKCRFSIAPGEALLLTLAPSTARYQSVTLGHPLWFNSLHPRHLQSSLNLAQSTRSADGSVRYVVCAEDPGLPNWLDTAGHSEGFLFVRYQQLSGTPPGKPDLSTIRLADLHQAAPEAAMPAETTDRHEHLNARRLALDARFF